MGVADWLRRRIDQSVRDRRERAGDDDIGARTKALVIRGNEYGYDAYGLGRAHVETAARLAGWMYRSYFRASAFGVENIPAAGRVLFVANHAGQLPYDGVVIGSACFLEPPQPRLVRSMVEHFVPTVPFASYLLARWGQIIGTPENCRRLLEQDEAILVFPEGARGISKPFSRRYQLAQFGLGFMRLALETNTPIVPVAVVGAEEQAPALMNVKTVAKVLGFPAFPITPTGLPFPLPSKYRLYFGDPLFFTGRSDDEDSELEKKVKVVKASIASMLERGLRERKHVFW
jgi:1-acyl-sn-glycerol-3-phosphate acyltransferase